MNNLVQYGFFNKGFNFKFSLRSTKVKVVYDILHNNMNYKNIKYLRLRATCNPNKKYASEAYLLLCDFWDILHRVGMSDCTKIIESDNPMYDDKLICYGHELLIINGKIKMTEWLI